MSKILFIGAIASVIAINSVFADTTVTSKQYVDAQDDAIYDYVEEELANKQNVITIDADAWDQRSGGGDEYISSAPLAAYGDGSWQGNYYRVLTQHPSGYGFSVDAWGEFQPYLTEEWQPAGFYTVPTTYMVADAIRRVKNTMTCAGWPDGVSHTDENCWLWNKQ